MVKGRRAAERRRERQGDDDAGAGEPTASAYVEGTASVHVEGTASAYGGDRGSTPEAIPAVPHDDYDEVDSVAKSQSAVAEPVAPPKRASKLVDDAPLDAEKSFARELKRKPREDTRARAGLEATEVREAKQRKVKAGARFVVISLPDGGEPPSDAADLPVAVYPCLIGRTASADLLLDDPTVSLRHAEIGFDAPDEARGRGSFSLADLGSSSGTLLNGVVVEGRVPLNAGDIVQLGKTELRFLLAEVAPQPRPEPPPEAPTIADGPGLPTAKEHTSTHVRSARELAAQHEARRLQVRRRALGVIAACLGLFVAVVVVRFAWQHAFSDAAPAQIRLQISSLLAEAKEKLLQGEVDDAGARVDTILNLDPTNEEAQSLGRSVATEMLSRDALQLALRLGDEDNDDEALLALGRIADSSVFARDRDRLRASLAARALVRSLRAVEGLLDQGRVSEALVRALAHVKRFPDDAGGQSLLARVQAAKSAQPKDPALFPARAAFADGRLNDARAIAAAAGYPGYVAELDRFQKSFDDGKALLTRFDGSAARAPLDEAFRLLGSLGGRASSPIFASVQKPYADALYLSGTEKFEAGDLCGAARELFKAARVVPEDRRVEIELQKLATRAEQGLVKARGAKVSDRDRARAIAGEHLCVAKSGTATYDELYELSR